MYKMRKMCKIPLFYGPFGLKIVNSRLCNFKILAFQSIIFPLQKKKEMGMDKKEMNLLATMVAEVVVQKLKGMRIGEAEYVDTKEAARIIGVSETYMRFLKKEYPDKYPTIKSGNKKQGRILFKRDALLRDFTPEII